MIKYQDNIYILQNLGGLGNVILCTGIHKKIARKMG